MMKKIYFILLSCFFSVVMHSQTTENYLARYNALISRVGVNGIGVETLLDKWEQADPGDINHMVARFKLHLAKSLRDSVVVNNKPHYLGMEPVFSLKDSLGHRRYYYNEKVFDSAEFAKSMTAIDNAIQFDNSRLDVALMKLDALVAYEKTLPDNAKDLLLSIVDRYFAMKSAWEIPDVQITDEIFLQEVQRYCITMFNIGSAQSMACLKQVSERVLKSRPKAVDFINNIGAYYASFAKDDKKALKYYRNALKIDPENVVARQNVSLIERRMASSSKK